MSPARAMMLAMLVAFPTGEAVSAEPGVLRIGATDVPAALGNPFRSAGSTAGSLWDLIFDGLVRFDDAGAMVPGLAESWFNSEPNVWRFTLRPGATFFDGASVDAAAVVGTIDILKNHPDFAVATEVSTIASALAIDTRTVEVRTTQPDAILPRRLAAVRIVDPAAWQRLGADGFAREPNGSGPYRVVRWGQGGERTILRANRASWRAPVSVEQVEVVILKDATTRVQALLSGQVDVALSLNPDDMETLTSAGFDVHVNRTRQIQVWALPNVLKPRSPLQDVRVRQAMNYAVDKEAMARALLLGVSAPASQGAPAGVFGFNPELQPYPYDPERARRLLAEAGYPDGFPLIADVLVGLGPADAQIHQKTAADLGAVGIRIELRSTPYAARPAKYYDGQWGDVDVFSTTWNSGIYMDVIRTAQDFSCAKPSPFYCDEEITALVRSSQTIMSPPDREQVLKQIMKLYRDRAAALYLLEYNSIIGHAPRVRAFSTRPTGLAVEVFQLND